MVERMDGQVRGKEDGWNSQTLVVTKNDVHYTLTTGGLLKAVVCKIIPSGISACTTYFTHTDKMT